MPEITLQKYTQIPLQVVKIHIVACNGGYEHPRECVTCAIRFRKRHKKRNEKTFPRKEIRLLFTTSLQGRYSLWLNCLFPHRFVRAFLGKRAFLVIEHLFCRHSGDIPWSLYWHSVIFLWAFCGHSVGILWAFCISWAFCGHMVSFVHATPWYNPIHRLNINSRVFDLWI